MDMVWIESIDQHPGAGLGDVLEDPLDRGLGRRV